MQNLIDFYIKTIQNTFEMLKEIQLFVTLIEEFNQQRSKYLERSIGVVETCFQVLYIKFILVKEGRFDVWRRRNKEGIVGRAQIETAEILARLVEQLNFVLENLLMLKYVHILQ